MDKLIEFLKSLFSKTADSFGKEKAAILKSFTQTALDLHKLNERIDAQKAKHDKDKVKAELKIAKLIKEQESLANEQLANLNVASKIEAILS